MDQGRTEWWPRHRWTVTILLFAFGVALLLRTVFTAGIIEQFGALYVYGGGSDSYYHSRVTTYIILNHRNLIFDPLLRYPTGAINPREPLFDWMNAVLGIVFAGSFGGNAVNAGGWFLSVQAPFWSAITVFPVYLIGKEVGSRRTGLVAAMIYPFLVANIESSTLGYANYLSFYTFFILLTMYSYMRTVKAVGSRRWVESYGKPRQIPDAIRAFVRTERTAVKWAVFTGVSFGALALAWQGYTFAVAIIVIFVIFALIVERVRRVDSFGLYIATWIVGLVGFPLAMPYYLVQGQFSGWFDIPLLVFFGTLLIALPFMFLRDYPWVVSVPVLVAVAGLAVLALAIVNNTFFITIVTGQGYFVKTLVYSTVAEAQAPSIDSLIIGYGVVTFFLAFVGLVLAGYTTARRRFPRVLMFFLALAVVSIYLPLSAAKFFYLGSPIFALLPAEAIVRALDAAGFPALRRNITALSDRRGKVSAFRRSFKLRQLFILLLVVGILVPNIWYAIDAGIPENTKSQFGAQIDHTLPPFLRTSEPNASNVYLGAAGVELDTPNQYDSAGYTWLSQQDNNLPPQERPAFISWWDYGFQAIDQGQHPSVADNFQHGIDPSGNFLLAQNETLAIGVLSATLLNAEQTTSGHPYLPASLNKILAADGLNLTQLHNFLVNTTEDVKIVVAHPNLYLPVDPNTITPDNAMYNTVSYLIASTLSESQVVKVYDDIQAYTGWTIRYGMVDTRLFPFSGTNTGIFYAPAELTGRVIGADGTPTSYYTLSVLGSDGNTYPINHLPADVTAVQVNINYLPAFFNTMLYHIYVGYNGTDVGAGTGIPGISGNVSSDAAMPGFMLDHFLAVYRTAYYCAGTNPTIDPGCLTATNYPDAQHLANVTKGYADTSTDQYYSGGETMLAYYTGVPLVGAVTLSDGTPVAGARVTVYDSWGTPHQSIVTAANGAYNLVLPPGNDTVNVTSGTFDGLTQAGSVHLLSMPIDVPAQEAYSFDAPTLVQNAVLQSGRVQGFVYWNTANNSSFQPSDPLATGAKVTLSLPFGATYTATTDASAAYTFSNLPPGVYNYSVTIRGSTFAQPSVTVSSTAPVNESTGLLPGRVVGSVLDSSGAVVPGAAVIALNQTGGVVTATSNSTGAYLLTTLVPGNYTIYAQVLSKSLASAPETVLLNTTITSASENLTVVPSTAFMLPVETSGYAGASGVQVRFTPILAAPPSSAVPNDSATSYTFVTSATGAATGVLPVGNYSVYAYGLIGPTYFAGIGNRAVLSSPTGNVSLAPLEMSAAVAVRGSVTIPTNSTDLTSVSVTAYDASGNQVTSYANSTGGFVIYAPPGSYTLLATLAATNASATSYSAATLVSTTSPTPVTLALTAAVRFAPTVGAPGPRSEFLPTSSGEVQVSLPNLGVRVFAPTNTTGVAHLIVPATLPGNGGSYCILAQAPGYSSFDQCGYTPLALGTVTQIPLTLNPVSVTVGLVGVPSNSTFTLNLTAASPTAQNVTTQGTTSLGVSALPGTYAVSGYAVVKGKPGFYMPLSGVTFTIPAGPPTATFSLPVHDQVRTIGVLGPLPSGIPAANVTLQLTSTIANFTLTGAAYTSPFFAPPTNYSVYATANVSSEHYAALTSVNVLSNGSILHAVTLSSAVTQTVFHLLQANNTALNTTATLTVQRGNLHLTTTTTDGLAGLFLPSDVTYTVGVNVTLLLRIGGVVQYQTFVAMPGLSCTPSGAATNCSVPLIATTHLVSLSIALRQGSTPVTLSSTIQLQGPYPSTQLITGTTTTGTFSTNLLPGHYSLYTLAGVGSDQLGNLTAILVEPTRSSTIPVQLQTTRTLTVVLVAPTSGLGTSPTLEIAGGTGANLTLANQLPQVPVSVVLPSGTYTVSANSTTTPFGVVTPARASQSISLLQGNALVTLTLSASLRYAASLAVLPPTTVELSTGGLATFAWVARNTGSAPETVKLVGSPGYLGFTFTPSSFTLGTSGTTNSTGGEVTISVPTGTSVQSPPIVLTAELSNGTVVGSTSGARVLLTAAPGVTVGASTIAPSVGPGLATVSFFVRNSGNVQVQADVTVANLAQLENFGWNVTVYNGKALVTNPVTLVEGANLTFQVNLRMIGAQAAPPGSVLLMAQTVGVAPPAHSEALLSVPTGAVQLNSTTASVTGPSVSSPPSTPTWLVPLLAFVPAMAFVVFAFVYRWSRTRRWVRT